MEILITKYTKEPDITDLKFKPTEMADCMMEKISDEIPGIPGDPRRDPYFTAYIGLSIVPTSKEQILKNFKQAEEALGSKQAVHEARASFGSFAMHCIETLGMEVAKEQDEKEGM